MIRTYQDEDFKPVLDLMERNSEFDTFSESLLKEKLYDDPYWNPESTLLALEDDSICGFMQGVSREIEGIRYGYIKLMAVEDNQRRKGVATRLYTELERIFIEAHVTNIRIYDVPLNYFMPGIDPRYTPAVCFAQKMGFQHNGEACNMIVDLESSDWDASEDIENLKSENIEIARAKSSDKDELLQFIAKEWILWTNELNMAMRSDPPALYIARQAGIIMAFSAYDGNNIGTGWFGPMGTDTSLRGKGVGSILLKLCLADIKAQGQKKSIIPWVAPVGFYSHYANAKIDRVFWRFEKIIG